MIDDTPDTYEIFRGIEWLLTPAALWERSGGQYTDRDREILLMHGIQSLSERERERLHETVWKARTVISQIPNVLRALFRVHVDDGVVTVTQVNFHKAHPWDANSFMGVSSYEWDYDKDTRENFAHLFDNWRCTYVRHRDAVEPDTNEPVYIISANLPIDSLPYHL